ncbi:protein containing Helix-turn-helix, AraC domain, partial [sediment metagenome]
RLGARPTPWTPRAAALLAEYLLVRVAETALPFGAFVSPSFATYRRCRDHIDRRWPHLRTLAQIAHECHVDGAYLCRLFQRFDHQSPYQRLLRLKMNHAAERLAEIASVKAVAAEFGFADPFHFSRVFKATMGVPPAQFIRLAQR